MTWEKKRKEETNKGYQGHDKQTNPSKANKMNPKIGVKMNQYPGVNQPSQHALRQNILTVKSLFSLLICSSTSPRDLLRAFLGGSPFRGRLLLTLCGRIGLNLLQQVFFMRRDICVGNPAYIIIHMSVYCVSSVCRP
jgi:hypothetical protein